MKLLFAKVIISLGVCAQSDNKETLFQGVSGAERPAYPVKFIHQKTLLEEEPPTEKTLQYINDKSLEGINKSSCCEFECPVTAQGILIQRQGNRLRVCGLNYKCDDPILDNKSFVDYLYDEMYFCTSTYKTTTLVYKQPIVSAVGLSYQNKIIISSPLMVQSFRVRPIKNYIHLTAPILSFQHVYVREHNNEGVIIHAPYVDAGIIDYIALKRIVRSKPIYLCGIIDFSNTNFESNDEEAFPGLEVVNAHLSIKFRDE